MSEEACDFNKSFFHFEIDHVVRRAITVTASAFHWSADAK